MVNLCCALMKGCDILSPIKGNSFHVAKIVKERLVQKRKYSYATPLTVILVIIGSEPRRGTTETCIQRRQS